MASESSSKTDFKAEENELRRLANAELKRRLLKDPENIPPGQLLGFVAKVGFQLEVDKPEVTQIKQQNVLAILGGLPPERAKELLAGMQTQIDNAKKELNSGG